MYSQLNNISIKAKLAIIMALLMVMITLISLFSFSAMQKIGHELDAIVEQDIPMTKIITSITEHQLEQSIHFERALRYMRKKNGEAHLQAERKIVNALTKKVQAKIRLCEQRTNSIIANTDDSETRAEFKHIKTLLHKISIEYAEFAQHTSSVFTLANGNEQDKIIALVEKITLEEDQLSKQLNIMLLEIERFTEKAGQRAQQHEKSAAKSILVLGFLALILGGLISWVIGRNIISRISICKDELNIIASGDLSQNIIVEGTDEIAQLQQSMFAMNNHLNNTVSTINNATLQMDLAANEISVIATQTSVNIGQQQLETEGIATAINQMSIALTEVAESVNATSIASNDSNSESQKGRDIVEQAVIEIQLLSEKITDSAVIVNEVEQHSDTITKVLAVIRAIADQTNLLALNAAIEAARAGEQGRGFAVVADEVRTLAGRTQEATEEINNIIEQLQSGSRRAVTSMNLSKIEVKTVVEQIQLTDHSLTKINQSVTQINDMNNQVASATEEQSAVSSEISNNIINIATIGEENNTGSEIIATKSKEMAAMSVELKGLISQFKVA